MCMCVDVFAETFCGAFGLGCVYKVSNVSAVAFPTTLLVSMSTVSGVCIGICNYTNHYEKFIVTTLNVATKQLKRKSTARALT